MPDTIKLQELPRELRAVTCEIVALVQENFFRERSGGIADNVKNNKAIVTLYLQKEQIFLTEIKKDNKRTNCCSIKCFEQNANRFK